MGSLKNHIIIAMPHMRDPYFGRSVVLICEHAKEGAMGLIINRPFKEPDLKELFTEIYHEDENILKVIPTVYFGGPIMIERGIVLHSGGYTANGTVSVSKDFALTSHKEILQDINKKKGPKQFKLMLGHAGWSEGQLEREIENGDWLLQSTTKDFVFKTLDKAMWNQAAQSFGIETSHIAGLGGLA